VGDHLIGATLYDGMVVQPLMVDSNFSPASSTVNNIQQASAEQSSIQRRGVK
jgi:hypothetical protein